jgi:hypothetical protein
MRRAGICSRPPPSTKTPSPARRDHPLNLADGLARSPASVASFQATGAAALELADCGGTNSICPLTILVADALASVLFSAVNEVCAKMAECKLVLQSSDLMGRWSVSSKRTLPK